MNITMNQLSNTFASTFDDMHTAQDIIAEEQTAHPDQADAIWNTFHLLRRSEPLRGKNPLYRAHCHEIINRAAINPHILSTQLPTVAEIVGFLSDVSLKVPLTHDQAALYERQFAILQGRPATPLTPGQNDILQEIIAGLIVKDRK